MIHERVDMARWNELFRLELQKKELEAAAEAEKMREIEPFLEGEWLADHRKLIEHKLRLAKPRARSVTSPCHLAAYDCLRAELPLSLPGGVPTDVFVFAKGERSQREVTKVGGLPYWPREKKWPSRLLGGAKTFVAQFCFADSTDIVGRLPGDVLLIFADLDGPQDCDPHGVSFHWMRLGETDLVGPSEIPKTGVTVAPCYGAIYRTVDYDYRFFNANDLDYDLAMIEGTKIGGIPQWIQDPVRLPGRFLCTLGSIQPACRQPFPWLNVPEPNESFSDPDQENLLMWGDVGTMYIFVDSRCNLHWTVQCY